MGKGTSRTIFQEIEDIARARCGVMRTVADATNGSGQRRQKRRVETKNRRRWRFVEINYKITKQIYHMSEKSQVEIINIEINRELSNEIVGKALLATTFKGLTAILMKQAIMEGMIRGFTFKDFLEKNIYALPFKNKDGSAGYSLVTSIDDARKRGMRSGIIGKDAPVYEYSDDEKKNILSCTVTVKRLVSGHIGDFTATVFFSEYNKGSNLWLSKPRTMIAKVAEMHALRMACPEELSQSYVEEELESEMREARIAKVTEVDSAGLKMGKFLKNENKNETKEESIVKDADSQEHPREE